MGIFDRFRRGKGKGKGEEPTPAPAPTPTPAPAPQAPAGEAPKEKKRGLFGRIADRVRGGGKKKPPAAPPAEAPPAAPPAPPEGPPPGPPGGPMPEGPEEPEEGGEGEEEAPEEKDYSGAPSSVEIKIPGQWAFSKKVWPGVVKGTLTSQAQVIEYLRAIDEGREQEAVEMIVEIFDDGSGFAAGVELDKSTWTLPQIGY
ncbi:hypothetical protein [Streptomyces sp. NPDC002324]